MAFLIGGKGEDGLDAQFLIEELLRLYDSGLLLRYGHGAPLERPMGTFPHSAALGILGQPDAVVAVDPRDQLCCRVTPLLAVCATANVVVTVTVGTRCAWYVLTGPLDAEQLPPAPGV